MVIIFSLQRNPGQPRDRYFDTKNKHSWIHAKATR